MCSVMRYLVWVHKWSFGQGPRAGINFNDGFGGGNILENNLMFNMV